MCNLSTLTTHTSSAVSFFIMQCMSLFEILLLFISKKMSCLGFFYTPNRKFGSFNSQMIKATTVHNATIHSYYSVVKELWCEQQVNARMNNSPTGGIRSYFRFSFCFKRTDFEDVKTFALHSRELHQHLAPFVLLFKYILIYSDMT